MAKYRVVTENSRGNEAVTLSSATAKAKLQTLKRGVTKYQTESDVNSLRVSFYRDEQGDLVLMVDCMDVSEDIRVQLYGRAGQIDTDSKVVVYPSAKKQ